MNFDDLEGKTILEFGAGLSSLLFATKVDKVVTFETQPGWINKIKGMANEEKNFIFHWDGKKIDTAIHEMVHVQQYYDGFIIGFIVKYLYWLNKYGFKNNPYEIAARKIQDIVRTLLK